MKRTHFIVGLAAAYLLIVGWVWFFQTRSAYGNLEETAEVAIRSVMDTLDYNVEPEAFRVARTIVNMFGDVEHAAAADVSKLAKDFEVEEINVVDRRGIVRATNRRENDLYDFASSESTAAYLALTNGTGRCLDKFRPSIVEINGDFWCKYVALPFPGGGFVQVGHSYRDFRHRLDYALERLMNDYQAGENGYYLLVDRQGGEIVSGFDPEMHGKPLSESGIDPKAFGSKGEIHPFTVFGMEAFVRRVRLKFADIDVYAVLSREDVFASRNIAVTMSSIILALVFLVGGGLFLKVLQQHEVVERLREKEDKKRRQDIKMASNIQHAAMPLGFPELPNARLFASMRPAKDVGGDFYDFERLSDGRLLVVCADVSDKGIPAAMFMMRSKSVIRSEVESKPTLVEAVTAANASLAAGNEDPVMFVTAWIGVLDLKTGEMEYVNAGHNPPYLRRADGTLEPLKENRGLVLAATDFARYRSGHVVLRAGDMLFLYTDGVTEAKSVSGSFYGEPRLESLLSKDREGAPEALCRKVVASVDAFAAGEPQADDITVLALAYGS